MCMLLILFMVFFGAVVFWAAPRLYRLTAGARTRVPGLAVHRRVDRIRCI